MADETKKLDQLRIIRDSLVFRYLPNPDDMIVRTPRGLLTYDDMLADSRIGSLFLDRRNGTTNLPVYITDTEDKRINEYRDQYLTEQRMRKFAWYLLTGALKYGFRPAEILWQRDSDGWLYIDSLKGHNINNYRFNDEGEMWYVGWGDQLLDQPYKWIVHRVEGDSYNEPYGVAYMRSAYWPWQFKRLGWQYWLTATEKFSVPSLAALFENSDPAKSRQLAEEVAEAVSLVTSGSGGALGNVKELKQLTMAGAVSDFDVLIKACDLQIAYAMTGQSLATNASDTGTQALGTVQERTKQAGYENDARALAYTMQRLIDISVEVNFGKDTDTPDFMIDTGDYASFTTVCQALDRQIPVSKRALYSRYGIAEPDEDVAGDAFVKPLQPMQYGMGMPVPSFGSSSQATQPKPSEDPSKQDPADVPLAPPAADPDKEGLAIDDTGAGVTLNGAQVTAATGIVKAVEMGELPRDSGLAQLKILFNLTDAQATEMMGSAGKNPRLKKDEEFADDVQGKKKVLILGRR